MRAINELLLQLAAWTMAARRHAIAAVLITLITSVIVWPNNIIGAALLSLVWLRKGAKEGILIGSWAVLPCIALTMELEQFSPLLLVCTISVTSWVLRSTRSFNLALLASSASCVIATFAIDQLAAVQMQTYAEFIQQWVQQLSEQLADNPDAQALLLSISVEPTLVAGLFGTSLAFMNVVSLVLARSWQAKLYNPGGFQLEFHQLRLGKLDILVLVLPALALFSLGSQYLTWVWVVLFPLLVAGTALFHAVGARRRISIHWYAIFYCTLLFWDFPKVVLMILAIADTFLDIRQYLPKQQSDLDDKR